MTSPILTAPFAAALLAVAVGGACIAVQAPINSRLGTHMGDPVTAAAISFIVGAIILSALVVLRGSIPSGPALAAVPWWAWAGGALGAVYVVAAVWAVGTLGVVTLVAALIFGQLSAALILDGVGAFGVPVRDISWTRIAAVAMVAGGLVLSRM